MNVYRTFILFCTTIIFLAPVSYVFAQTAVDDQAEVIDRLFVDNPQQVLGFDPATDPINIATNNGVDPIVICAHGFGDSKNNFSSNLAIYAPGCPRNMFVCFDFRDHRLSNGSMPLRYANLGQEPDARVVLFHIVKCFCKGHKNIVLFAHSRGAAATIRALDMLSDPYRYRKTWEAFGFGAHACALQIDCIRAIQQTVGRVYLARPLLDVRQALLQAGKYATGTYLAPVTAMVLRSFARVFSKYNVRAEEPIDILKRLSRRADYQLYIFFAPNDRVVGNIYDDFITNTLAKDPANHSMLEVHSTGIEHIEVKDAAEALTNYLLIK